MKATKMTRKIISIDDSDIAQEVIKLSLAEFGFEDIQSFLDPKEALNAISSGGATADLILLDIMMPGIDGIELCARIRGLENWSDIPIIMLTSRKDTDSLSQAFLAGANDYVTKPFDRIELQARIRSCLRLKGELDRRRASDRRSSSAANNLLTASRGTAPIPGLSIVSQRLALQNALQALGADTLDRVGIVCFCIDQVHGPEDIDNDHKIAMIKAVGHQLGQVQMPAGDLFGHWDDDVFCLISLNLDETQLLQAGHDRVSLVSQGEAGARLPNGGGAATISAGVVLPGTVRSLAGGVADAITAAIKASRSSQGLIIVPSQPDK